MSDMRGASGALIGDTVELKSIQILAFQETKKPEHLVQGTGTRKLNLHATSVVGIKSWTH